MLIFAELKTAVGQLIEREDSTFATKIEGYLNIIYRGVIKIRPWSALLRQIIVPTISAQDYIITGQEVDQIIDLHQRQTPVILALERYYATLHRHIDNITQNDNPTTAIPMGEVGVSAALASDGTLTFVSSNASDTTQIIRVRGYDTNKLPIQESITLNGTSAVTSANSYESDEGYEPRFSKDSDTLGIITIQRAAATIAQISTDEREARYKKWRLFPNPSSAIDLHATFKKRTYKLEQAEDTPELEMDNLLILGAFALSLQEKRQIAKAGRIWGSKDIDGSFPPGTYGYELDTLIAQEPQFSQNAQDQFLPQINRDPIDTPDGHIGTQIRESS